MPSLSPEVAYVGLLFGLFVVPRILQRWRVPSAITSLALGALAGPGLGLFTADHTVDLLSTLGIVALFLFAGLEVNVLDLRRESRVIVEHLLVRLAALAACAVAITGALSVEARPAILVALAILTPSTGFILDSLPALGLPPQTVFWVRSKAVATELVALGAFFVTLQSDTAWGLAASTLALLAMILLLPVLFRWFARFVLPYAPRTEFAFLLMISVAAALVTKSLGVYYLVGAFVVGMVAQRLREQLPALASEKMVNATEAFASIFVPFYFFHAGASLRPGDFTIGAVLFGLALLAVFVPVRLALVWLHRSLRLGETFRESLRVGVPMLPTLVFTLVIAGILRDRFELPTYVFGGLIVYTLLNTVIPAFVFRIPTPEFEALEAPQLAAAGTEASGLGVERRDGI